jgi:hypothetical protein
LALDDLRHSRPDIACEHLSALIKDFLRSPIPSEDLKATLRADLRRRR